MTRPETEPPNGAPLPAEDTDPGIRSALHSASGIDVAPAEGRPTAHDIASTLVELMGSRGGGPGGGDFPKSLKRHNWIFAIVIALFGSGGVVASYYATAAQVESNAKSLDEHESKIDANTEAVSEIKESVDELGDSIGEQRAVQKQIVEGVEELKRENVKKLADELDEVKRENRRLRRRER